ncbi:MAG: FAD-dependent oxidoreductase, partial [Oscillospiraceae bacterium]|nr:FAD-dependent oxidoreductase [Oscillospiraceae bacterium]
LASYKGKAVAVNGGGNSALQDAMLLSEGCSRVYLIHRRDSFRGEAKLAEALKKKENVEFVLNSSVTALIGDTELTAITVTDREGVSRNIEAEGLFVAIGHSPDNRVFEELMELDEAGYVLAGEDCRTRTPGLFTAGDCRRKTVRQLTTAMADGSAAALAACSYIDSL